MIITAIVIYGLVIASVWLDKKGITKDDNDNYIPDVLEDKVKNIKGKVKAVKKIVKVHPSKKEQITTSTGTTECSIIDPNIPILAIPYLPAGLELYRGARNLIPNSNKEADIISKTFCKTVIFDRLKTSEKLIKQIKKNGKKVITFDDIGKGRKFSDISCVIPSFFKILCDS